MNLRFAVVHEAEADFRTATHLADRVLIEAVGWLDEHLVVDQREWIGANPAGQRLTWKGIPTLAKELGIKAHGHINGEPLEPDAGAARRAILYVKAVLDDLAAVVLLRDQDDQRERRDGLEQARGEHLGSPIVLVGLAVVEREAWVLAGFEPQDGAEQMRLDAERRLLGFYPHERSHELTACKDDTAPRSPKRALRALTDGDADRERRCWNDAPLDRLRSRGTQNGLAQYFEEVRTRLAPLIGHVPRRIDS